MTSKTAPLKLEILGFEAFEKPVSLVPPLCQSSLGLALPVRRYV